MRDWRKITEKYARNCHECGKKISVNEERYASKQKNRAISLFYHLNCGKNINDKEINKAKKIISQAFAELAQIRAKETNPNSFSSEDYKKIKNWQKKMENLSKKDCFDDDFITSDIQDIQVLLSELENLVTQKNKPQDNQDNPASNQSQSNQEPRNNDNNQPLDNNNQEEENNSNDNNNPNRERKREQKDQLQQAINNLTNKPNRTPAEEQDLKDKKEELERLNKPVNNEQEKGKNNWLKPTLIISGVVLISGLVIYLISKNKKKY